jgi:cytidylate kinase
VPERINIAIDGPASSGKGTVARLVASRLGFTYIDTGAMFRAVALQAEAKGVSWTDQRALGALVEAIQFAFTWQDGEMKTLVNGVDVTGALRREDIGLGASAIAVFPAVRAGLLSVQQALSQGGGVVMDGRDIGSIVLPDAELKIFLDASVGERAKRRTQELSRKGVEVSVEYIEKEIIARDTQDKNRATAPLIQTPDATYLDTTGRDPEGIATEVVQMARRLMG